MNEQEVRDQIDEIRRTMFGPTAEAATYDLLDEIDGGDAADDGTDWDQVRSDVIAFLLTEVPFLLGVEGGLGSYFSDVAGDDDDDTDAEALALGMIEDLRLKMEDELDLWNTTFSAETYEAFLAHDESPGFAKGGYPASEINVARVQGQAISLQAWIDRKITELQNNLYGVAGDVYGPETRLYRMNSSVAQYDMLQVVQGLADAALDEWARVFQYGKDAVASFQVDYREFAMMLNWKNTFNQFVVGMVFAFISGVVMYFIRAALAAGSLPFLDKWLKRLNNLRDQYDEILAGVNAGTATQSQLDDVARMLSEHERLTNANIIRYGMPQTGLREMPVRLPSPTPTRSFSAPSVDDLIQQPLAGFTPGRGQLPLLGRADLIDDIANIADDAFNPNAVIGLSDDALAQLRQGQSVPFNMPGQVVGEAPVLPGQLLDDFPVYNPATPKTLRMDIPEGMVGAPPTGHPLELNLDPLSFKKTLDMSMLAAIPALGATGVLDAWITSVETKVTAAAMPIIQEIVGPDIEARGYEVIALGGGAAELEAMTAEVLELHRNEIELQVNSLLEEIAESEPLPELPMTVAEGQALIDAGWVGRIDALSGMLTQAADNGSFSSIFTALISELSFAATPEEVSWANGIKGLAENLMQERVEFEIGIGLPTAEEAEANRWRNP